MPEVELNCVLLEHTPEPEKLVELAARRCTHDDMSGIDFNNLSALQACVNKRHYSVLEHIYFTFHVQGVSRALLAQITRHRLASFSVYSQRYNKEDDFNFVVPERIKEMDPRWGKTEFEADMRTIQEIYNKWHKKLIDAGYTEKEANEDARFVTPQATETKFVVTMNARELLHVFTLRCCQKAQWEIQELAKSMLRQCKQVAPTIFKDAGPECVRSICPEGSNTCGKQWTLDE